MKQQETNNQITIYALYREGEEHCRLLDENPNIAPKWTYRRYIEEVLDLQLNEDGIDYIKSCSKEELIDEYGYAIDLDKRIRKMRPPYDLFVHQDRIPLAEVDLRSPQEMGQIDMFENECNGVCGI